MAAKEWVWAVTEARKERGGVGGVAGDGRGCDGDSKRGAGGAEVSALRSRKPTWEERACVELLSLTALTEGTVFADTRSAARAVPALQTCLLPSANAH